MKFTNYCMVVMGLTDGITSEVFKVAEKILGVMNAKGIVIVTFTSTAGINELTDFFKFSDRNFILSVLDDRSFGYNITRNDIKDELFGKVEQQKQFKIIHNSLDSNTLYKKTGTTIDVTANKKIHISDEEIKSMDSEEKNKKMNEIIEKGIENLTDYDKLILEKLSK